MTDTGFSFNGPLTISQAQYDALAADPEAFAAWATLPNGVTVTGLEYLGRVTDPDDETTVIGYACAHPRFDPELMGEALKPALLADIKQRRATDGPEWADAALEAVRTEVEAKTEAERRKAADDNTTRLKAGNGRR